MDRYKLYQRWLSGAPTFGPPRFTRWRRLPRPWGWGLMFVDHKPHKVGRALATAEDRRPVSMRKQSHDCVSLTHDHPHTQMQWARILIDPRFMPKWGCLKKKSKLPFDDTCSRAHFLFDLIVQIQRWPQSSCQYLVFIKAENVNQSHIKGYGCSV